MDDQLGVALRSPRSKQRFSLSLDMQFTLHVNLRGQSALDIALHDRLISDLWMTLRDSLRIGLFFELNGDGTQTNWMWFP